MNLITGHKGYIGSHLLPALEGQWETCDLKDGQDYRAIKGRSFDTVIHLAASVSVTESLTKPDEYMKNNGLGVAEFLRDNDVRRMVLISTGGAMYGNKHLAKEEDVPEASALTPYARSKFVAEVHTCVLQSMPGKSSVVLRLANVFGGDYSVRGEAAVHAHFATDDPITVFGGTQVRDFVHIDTVCEAIRRSLVIGNGTYNIGSGEETSIAKLAEEYGEMRGVPVVYKPKRNGEIDYISLDCSKAKEAGLI